MGLQSNDTDERVEQLIVLTTRLTELMGQEAALFEARKPREVARLSAETGRLANLYRHESTRIRSQPDLIAGADPARRERLVAETKTFEAVLARHGRAVEAAKTVTEGLVRAIAEEVAIQRSQAAGYGPGAKACAASTTSVALNQRA